MKLQAFTNQTVDGDSAILKGFRGGEAVVTIAQGSSLGGGAIEVLYNLEPDGSGSWSKAGTISDLSEAESWNVMIPYETAVMLRLVGSTGASVNAWLSWLHR